MSTVPTRQNVVSFEARRSERTSVEAERLELDELRRTLEAERAELVAERSRLEQLQASLNRERTDFEEELAVLEDQRHFLDAQREKLRQDTATLEGERDSLERGRAIVTQRQRVDGALDEARRSREAEKMRLQAEMAGLLQQAR